MVGWAGERFLRQRIGRNQRQLYQARLYLLPGFIWPEAGGRRCIWPEAVAHLAEGRGLHLAKGRNEWRSVMASPAIARAGAARALPPTVVILPLPAVITASRADSPSVLKVLLGNSALVFAELKECRRCPCMPIRRLLKQAICSILLEQIKHVFLVDGIIHATLALVIREH